MLNFIAVAKRIYRLDYWREAHRAVVFVVRAYLHYPTMAGFWRFFQEDVDRRAILERNAFPIEQATRAFFFKGATLSERIRLIKEHFLYLQRQLRAPFVHGLYADAPILLWRAQDGEGDWHVELASEAGQRKEGMLSLIMKCGDAYIYQAMFWIARDKEGAYSLFIGALQGPNMEHAREVVKALTKRAHRYRTKNLMLYMVRATARALSLQHIYAVSNEGYYANNHIRRDRKLKTDFGAFWEEAGGHVTDDPRFYELPLTEARKTEAEIPTRKRANYRRRYAMLDAIDASVASSMNAIKKASGTDRKD